MNVKLSKTDIGQRIAELRRLKGLSQEELSKRVVMSRSSLAQIELGNRSIDILELMQLSKHLGFSLDEFVSDSFVAGGDIDILKEEGVVYNKERVSVPEMQISKLRSVLLYILERCAGKPNVGETVLYKLLYFSDFNYYELYEEHLTGFVYRKLPYGPVPQSFDLVVSQMVNHGLMQRVKVEYHGYSQTRFLPLVKSDLTKLLASEKDVIDRVIDQFSDWSATAISNYSHKDIPWFASKDGDVIDYELVFYREAPFSVRNYEEIE